MPPDTAALDPFLPAPLRHAIEERWWAPIGEAAALERFIDDPALLAAPDRHPALFSDHGTVHVRDVAACAAALAPALHGVLLPLRDAAGVRFVQGLAVLLAYFHDIGMVEPSAAGRRVHPQFAAQTVLGEGCDALAAALWQADAAGLRTRLAAVHGACPGALPPAQVAREVMALALAHSKSAVPAPLLDDRPLLRRLMQRACFTDLAAQRGMHLAAQAAQGRDAAAPGVLLARYADADRDAFAWLADARAPWAQLAGQVVDAVRVLRAADALRQRGTTLRTSAGYEVCTDLATGEAVVGLRSAAPQRALLLRFHNPISAAEANIRDTQITPEGGLAVSFWRGAFSHAAGRAALLAATADVIADIDADALGSFSHPQAPPLAARHVTLHAPADEPCFADDVAALLQARHPRLAARVCVAPGDDAMPVPPPPAWAAQARPLPAGTADELFARLAAHGLNVAAMDRRAALAVARRVRVAPGTVLIESGSPATFVVVPLGEGLQLQPTGGWPPQRLPAWMPVGVTGVARGGRRNARVAAQTALDVLVIDAAHYLAEWFRPYGLAELRRANSVNSGLPAIAAAT